MIYQKRAKFLTGISLIITIPHEVASIFNSHFGNEVREAQRGEGTYQGYLAKWKNWNSNAGA